MTQKPDLDFFELEKLIPNDLARLASKEDIARKSMFKQRKDPKVTKKSATAKRSSSEQLINPNVAGEKSFITAGNTPRDITLIFMVQALRGSDSAPVDATLPLESGAVLIFNRFFLNSYSTFHQSM